MGFTNAAGETHTLQFLGEDESAKLGIATTAMPVRQSLDEHPDKGTPKWVVADKAVASAQTIIFSPARKSEEEKERRRKVAAELARVSQALAD